MGTKMKGLLKGLRYISQIFEDEKEPEMQIGYPTDVKHVAHIGRDGPSMDSPSWMKEFNSSQGFQSDINEEVRDNTEIKWVSEDTKRSSSRGQNTLAKELTEAPRSSRGHSLPDCPLTSESRTRDPSTKSKQSRRHQPTTTTKDSILDTTKPNRQDSSLGSESHSGNLPDIPKKTRRKKSKELTGSSGGSTRSRSKANAISTTYTSPFSDPGPGTGSMFIYKNKEFSQTSSLYPLVKGEEKE